jgi:hypothetical protein
MATKTRPIESKKNSNINKDEHQEIIIVQRKDVLTKLPHYKTNVRFPSKATASESEENEVEYFYQFPNYSTKNVVVVGTVLLFHGCNHDGIDWFELPEEKRIVKYLLQKGFVVISVSSYDRTESKCWDTYDDGGGGSSGGGSIDVDRIVATMPILFKEMEQTHNVTSTELPLYGIGASSGGDFVSVLQNHLNFRGITVMISPGSQRAWMALKEADDDGDRPSTSPPPIRIAFVYMPNDTRWASEQQITYNVREYLSNIPVQTYRCGPIPVTTNLLVERIEGLSTESANIVIRGLLRLNIIRMVSEEPNKSDGKNDDDGAVLVEDPRRVWNQIEQVLVNDVHAEPSLLMIESIREVLNVAYAYHELTSEHVDKVVQFWLNRI